MAVTVTLLGQKEAVAAIDGIVREMKGARMKALKKSLVAVERRAAYNITNLFRQGSGNLRRSLTSIADPGGQSGRVGVIAVQARMLEFGGKMKRHPIFPRFRKALRFPSNTFIGPIQKAKSGVILQRQTEGSMLFRKSVDHPGGLFHARPYMRPALVDSLDDIQQFYLEEVGELIRKKARPTFNPKGRLGAASRPSLSSRRRGTRTRPGTVLLKRF